MNPNRRKFMQNVGSGMLIAGLGSNLAIDLGVANERDLLPATHAHYGDLSQWVHRMQDMRPDKLLEVMVSGLNKQEVSLKQLVTSAALANAETFGGQDYVGYHAEMALIPATFVCFN